jgi:hypothetical protein
MRLSTDQPERGNEVKPIAQLGNDLPDPQSSERAIAPQELCVSQGVHDLNLLQKSFVPQEAQEAHIGLC